MTKLYEQVNQLRRAIIAFADAVTKQIQKLTERRLDHYIGHADFYVRKHIKRSSAPGVDVERFAAFRRRLIQLDKQNSRVDTPFEAFALYIHLWSVQMTYSAEIKAMEEWHSWNGVFDAMFFPRPIP